MKSKILFIIAFVAISLGVTAQTPYAFNYQSVVRDASGQLLINQAVGVQISLLRGSASGVISYQETFTLTTNDYALVNLRVGEGTFGYGDFDTINWANGPYFMQVSMDFSGGNNYIVMGASQLVSVPYAIHAKVADSIAGGVLMTEFDPVFAASVANGITALDTANWNAHIIDTDTHIDSSGISGLGYVTGSHTVDTDTHLDSAGVAGLGFTSGQHTIDTDTHIDSSGISGLGYVAGSHTVDTDTHLDSAGVAGLGFTSGQHTIDTDTHIDSSGISGLGYVAGAHTIDTDTQLSEAQVDAFVANNGYLTSEVDGSITNEIQDLQLTGNTLVITNNTSATSIDLSGYLDNTDTQLSETQVDAFVANNGYLTTEVDGSATNEIQSISLSNDTIYLSNGGYVKLPVAVVGFNGQYTSLIGAPINVSHFVNDAGYLTSEVDGSVTNELQTISKSGATVTLSDGGGNFTDENTQLSETQVDNYVANNGYLTSFTEVDGSISNELQTISKSGSTVTLSDGGGSFTDANTQLSETQVDAFVANNGYLTSFTEVDGSVTNEIQAISISNDTVFLSNGGYVKLPATAVGFDGQYSSLTGAPTTVSTFTNDAGYLTTFSEVDGSVTNELQTISKSGSTVTLSDGGGNFTDANTQLSETQVDAFVANNGYLTTEVDGSITNEIQNLSLSGSTLSISSGNSVDLQDASVWDTNSVGTYYSNPVAIGGAPVSNKSLAIHADSAGTSGLVQYNVSTAFNWMELMARDNGKRVSVGMGDAATYGNAFTVGINSGTGWTNPIIVEQGASNAVIRVTSNGNVGINYPSVSSKMAVVADTNEKVVAAYNQTGTTTNWRRGVYGIAEGSTTTNRGINGYANGSGTDNFGVAGFTTGAGTGLNSGVFGYGTGSTSENIGVRGWTNGASTTGNNAGVSGLAQGVAANTGSYGQSISAAGNSYMQFGVRGSSTGSGTGAHSGVWGQTGPTQGGVPSGARYGVVGMNTDVSSSYATGVYGYSASNTTTNYGVDGTANSSTGKNYGVGGFAYGTSSENYGLYGYSASGTVNNYSVYATTSGTGSGDNMGVYGESVGTGTTGINHGVEGFANGNSNENRGVFGATNGTGTYNNGTVGISDGTGGTSTVNTGVYGNATGGTTANYGVYASTNSTNPSSYGVYAKSTGVSTQANWAIRGHATGSTGTNSQNVGIDGTTNGTGTWNLGVFGYASGTGTNNYGVYGLSANGTNNYAGFFDGNVTITGNLNVTGSIAKGSGTFKIDHPLDPENKYLVHSFVESPEMMNVYSGNITTDANGFATVDLPAYFEAANKDFRYQLTVMGSFAQAIIKDKIAGNKFVIQTNNPNIEVSWQVTGVRSDKYAESNRVVPELEKTNKGTYLHPELYGESSNKSENEANKVNKASDVQDDYVPAKSNGGSDKSNKPKGKKLDSEQEEAPKTKTEKPSANQDAEPMVETVAEKGKKTAK